MHTNEEIMAELARLAEDESKGAEIDTLRQIVDELLEERRDSRIERIVPKEILCLGSVRPVLSVLARVPGSHPGSPIKDDLTAVEIVTEAGSRWLGTERAWIGTDLEMHVLVNPADDVKRAWPAPAKEDALSMSGSGRVPGI